MSDKTDKKSLQDRHQEHRDQNKDWYELTHKNWRAWGSWFSWGSPVGLGLFFLETAGAVWIIAQIFQ